MKRKINDVFRAKAAVVFLCLSFFVAAVCYRGPWDWFESFARLLSTITWWRDIRVLQHLVVAKFFYALAVSEALFCYVLPAKTSPKPLLVRCVFWSAVGLLLISLIGVWLQPGLQR